MTDRLRLRTQTLDWKVIDDEVVMLDGEQSTYLATNASGTLLGRMLAEGATRDELVDGLAAAFEIDRARAAADTDSFLAELRGRGLLEES
jgi:hypothetical protein